MASAVMAAKTSSPNSIDLGNLTKLVGEGKVGLVGFVEYPLHLPTQSLIIPMKNLVSLVVISQMNTASSDDLTVGSSVVK